MINYMVAFCCVLVCLVVLVHAQDQSGFLSIDCGLPLNSTYVDDKTGISYVSDAKYLNTVNGVNGTISIQYQTSDLDQQLLHVRSFPQGTKNCYTLKPPRDPTRSHYFIRARFLYGNYDNKNKFPIFDLYFGVDYWATVQFPDGVTPINKEILHVPSNTSVSTYVCLVNTGQGTPFISALEVRLVDSGIYPVDSGSLQLYDRYDFRSYDNHQIIRYKDDMYDRLWNPVSFSFRYKVSDLITDMNISENSYAIPSVVMQTAITPLNANDPIEYHWLPPDPTATYYLYMHFADFQSLMDRTFDITVNNRPFYSNLSVPYMSSFTLYTLSARAAASQVIFSFTKTTNSKLPPIFNALEIYTSRQFSYQLTDKQDLEAISLIKDTYQLKKDWQGDPCLPSSYSWEYIGCYNMTSDDDPRIISLNLSSNGLSGGISSFISNLTLLESLDLSNNNLTGVVPDFLGELKNLKVLILSKNHLSGIIPQILVKRSKKNLLKLSVEGNTRLCESEGCPEKKNGKTYFYIIFAVVGVIVLLIGVGTVWILVRWKKSSQQQGHTKLPGMKMKGRPMDTNTTNRRFTYPDILSITNNLETVIGKGGFGPVYHGYLEGTEVAVKMLSSSSIQGYKEFCAEIDFLTRVHHVNLTTLIGYCDEDDNIGLIYEYMANGNLKEHLSDKQPIVMSWEERLRIAVDAATGLEYLHHGCKPPIIHRDVKSDNILLDQKFQGKLGDFGLSKDFPTGDTHVSTAVAGTPGYLDPEYYISYQLTEKSDTFSFGVVLLEIITGKPVLIRDQKNAHIIQRVSFMLKNEEDITNIVDTRLGVDFEMNSLRKVTDIAMACASPTSAMRPSMNRVVIELNNCLALEMTRKNGSVVTEIEEEPHKCYSNAIDIEVESINFNSEISLLGR